MTLLEYLDSKPGQRAMTSGELKVIGLRFPQKKGWVSRLGSMILTDAQVEEMKAYRKARMDRRAANRLKREGKQVTVKPNKKKIRRNKDAVNVTPDVSKSKVDPASNEFLLTYEWRVVRMMALEKYGAVCQCCGASPKTGAVINVDHIKPRRLFPHLALDVNNLQILCHECNHGKGNWSQTDWRAQVEPDLVLSTLNRIKSNIP